MTMALQEGVLEHVQLERGNFSGQILHTTAPTSRVDWGSYNLAVLARGDMTPDMVSLTLAVGGLTDWRVYGHRITDGDMVAFPEGGELMVALPRQAQWLSLQVHRSRLETAGVSTASLLAASATKLPGAMHTGLRRALSDLAPVLAPQAALTPFGDAAVAQAHDELLSALLSELVMRSGKGDSSAPLNSAERWRLIRRAEAYLESVSDATVRIDDLCVATGTSLSRLERAFKDAFGLSPRRFLMLRRLAAVRGELLKGDKRASVTEIATRWGFFHLGRFSREYHLHYAERPSQTLLARRR